MEDFEKIIIENGFESIKEFNNLVSNANISTPEKVKAFRKWQLEDGTKAGLLKLI